MSHRPASRVTTTVSAVSRTGAQTRSDVLAAEEPLEIRVSAAGQTRSVAVTMRTPGADFELAAGFLYGEGVIDAGEQLTGLRYCVDPGAEQEFNIVTADLSGPMPDLGSLERHFTTTSACGVCGKASLDAIAALGGPELSDGPMLDAETVLSLPRRLRDAQRLFEATGGLHAAAVFDRDGVLLEAREDVGRHNAMDKLVGWGVLDAALPFTDRVVLVSGRASFELLQKARRAGAAFVCAVSAPSSLAVDVARRFGMTLVGFLREDTFNVYAGEHRVAAS